MKPTHRQKNYCIGSVVSICDTYYPLSYWYIYGFSSDTYTLIALDNNLKPIMGPKAMMIKIDRNDVELKLVQDPTQAFTPKYKEVFIPSYFIFEYYQNRCGINLKYGDIVMVETQYMTYQPFFILNKEDESHILYDMGNKEYRYDTAVTNLYMPFTHFNIVSSLKLRAELIEKAQFVQKRLKDNNYSQIDFIDQYIKFTNEIDYIMEKEELSIVDNLIDSSVGSLNNLMEELSLEDHNEENSFNQYFEPISLDQYSFPNYETFDMWNCNEPISPTFSDVINQPITDEDYIRNLKNTVLYLEYQNNDEQTSYSQESFYDDADDELESISTHIEVQSDSDISIENENDHKSLENTLELEYNENEDKSLENNHLNNDEYDMLSDDEEELQQAYKASGCVVM